MKRIIIIAFSLALAIVAYWAASMEGRVHNLEKATCFLIYGNPSPTPARLPETDPDSLVIVQGEPNRYKEVEIMIPATVRYSDDPVDGYEITLPDEDTIINMAEAAVQREVNHD